MTGQQKIMYSVAGLGGVLLLWLGFMLSGSASPDQTTILPDAHIATTSSPSATPDTIKVTDGDRLFSGAAAIIERTVARFTSVADDRTVETETQLAAKSEPQSAAETTTPSVDDHSSNPMPEPEPQTTEINPVPLSSAPVGEITVMAWLYPGEPACNALVEAADGRTIDVLKPEFFRLIDGGELEFMTEERFGCNGYSEATVAEVKRLSQEQYVMVSSAYARDMDAFLERDAATGEYTARLANFVRDNGFTGIEIDFEDYGGWTADSYRMFLSFVSRLDAAMAPFGGQIIVDVPPTRNVTEEQWYVLRTPELLAAGADYVLVMTYDYQFDHGVGEAVAPLDWMAEVVAFTRSRIADPNRIIIGVPSYGYTGRKGGLAQILTKEQALAREGADGAARDPASSELMWQNGNQFTSYADSQTITDKINVVKAGGISTISIWHLGGNDWFIE